MLVIVSKIIKQTRDGNIQLENSSQLNCIFWGLNVLNLNEISVQVVFCFPEIVIDFVLTVPCIKGILWDRQWNPSICISPQRCRFVYRNAQETKQSIKFQGDPSAIASNFIVLLFNWYLYLILHKFCSVLTCDILGIGLL